MEAQKMHEEKGNRLVVLWTSPDPEVAMSMVFMYTHAAKKYHWFEDVTLVIWGPSAKLISHDEVLQSKLNAMKNDGVRIEACIACANMFEVTDKLRELGYIVKTMGEPLTDYLNSDAKILTV